MKPPGLARGGTGRAIGRGGGLHFAALASLLLATLLMLLMLASPLSGLRICAFKHQPAAMPGQVPQQELSCWPSSPPGTQHLGPDLYGRLNKAALEPNAVAGEGGAMGSTCRVLNLTAEDPGAFQYIVNVRGIDPQLWRPGIPKGSPDVGKGYLLHSVQVWLDGEGRQQQVRLPQACAQELQRQRGQPDPVFTSYASKIEYGLVEEGSAAAEGRCARVAGTWFLMSPMAGARPLNLWDRLSGEWYPNWLLRHALFGAAPEPEPRLFLTHVNGVLEEEGEGGRGHPFLPAYAPLGAYVDWREVLARHSGPPAAAEGRGGEAAPPRCLEFEHALTADGRWLWAGEAVPTYESPLLQGYVDALVGKLGLADLQPDPCRPRLLLAARDPLGQAGTSAGRSARYIDNSEAVEGAMRAALPGFDVQRLNLGTLSFGEAVAAVRRASVLAFPHGGAGSNLLWLRRGAVVIEFFPHQSADPMYRNLAVLTGKAYLSWQAPAFLEADPDLSAPAYAKHKRVGAEVTGYHFSPKSAFRVDLQALAPLLQAAAWVVRGTLGDSWAPVNAPHHTTALTPWIWRNVSGALCPLGT